MPNSPSLVQLATLRIRRSAPLLRSTSLNQSLVSARFRVRLGARGAFP
ncbi:MAG: hypothetical protein QMC95_06320 [Desulfitobacteriaceae bacterium]|nr:hypothetical protein [Desulfitobacteriaceae bacterium]MDI6913820.1 hypothetical protein [Desulfitobacteriaceae bacterium]